MLIVVFIMNILEKIITTFNNDTAKDKLKLFIYILIIAVYPFLFIKYGLNFTDGPYHYLNFETLNNRSIMTFGATFMGHLLFRVFGGNFVTYRIIMALMSLVSIFILVTFISKEKMNVKLKWIANSVLLFFSLGIYILSWDIFTMFFLSIILLFIYKYYINPNLFFLLLISVVLSLMVSVKITNIIVIPILIILQIMNRNKIRINKRIFHLLFMLILSGILYYILYRIFLAQFTTPQSINVPTNLDINYLISRTFVSRIKTYVRNTIYMVKLLCVFIALEHLYNAFASKNKNRKIINLIVFSVLLIYYFYEIGKTPWSSMIIIIALFYLVTFKLLYLEIIKKNKRKIRFYLVLILISFIPAVGSDTGITKASMIIVCILPIMIIQLEKELNKNSFRFINLIISQFVILAVINIGLIRNTYEDGRVLSLNSSVDHPKLRFIKTTKARKNQILKFLSFYKKNSKKGKTIFIGYNAHLYNYLISEKSYPEQSFFMIEDDEIDILIEFIDKNEVYSIIYVYGYPDISYHYGEDTDKWIKAINESGFETEDKGNNYVIFKNRKISHQ